MTERDGKPPEEKTDLPRDAFGFQEDPAPQGLKKPPTDFGIGEDSGEWTRGGGVDPNEPVKPAKE